jgi:hypothetical protein
LARSADSDESASETHALIAAAHRLDNLIHHRRMALAASAPPASASLTSAPPVEKSG